MTLEIIKSAVTISQGEDIPTLGKILIFATFLASLLIMSAMYRKP